MTQQVDEAPALPARGDSDAAAAPPVRGRRAPAKPRGSVLRRILRYGVSRTAVEGLLGARGIALAGILGPELFGVWALFQMGLRYCAFAGLGLLRGLEVEVARTGSDGERPYTARQAYWGRIVAGHSLWLYGVLSVGAGLAWLFWGGAVASLALLGIALGLLLDRLWMYGLTFLRAAGSLRRFAVLELAHAALQFGLTAALALVWGLAGAFAGFALATLAALGLLAGRTPLRPRWAPGRAWHLLRIGFPVSLAGVLTASLATADRLLVGALEGVGALGVYAFAVALSGLGVSCALMVRNVILTDVYRRRGGGDGGDGGARSGRLLLDRTMAVFASLVPPLAGAVALGLAPAVATLLPQYRAAIVVAQVFVFTGTVQGLVNVAILGIVAAERQGRLPVLTIGAIGLNVALSLVALRSGLGLAGVAVAALLTRTLYAATTLALLTGSTGGGPAAAGGAARLLAPTLWCAAVVFAIGHAVPAHDPKMLAVTLPAYAVGLLPLVPLIRRTLAALRDTG